MDIFEQIETMDKDTTGNAVVLDIWDYETLKMQYKRRMKCEACGEREQSCELNLKREHKPYKLCLNCLWDLVNHKLTSEQYFNLLKNNHKSKEFMIHSCYYDDEGYQMQ